MGGRGGSVSLGLLEENERKGGGCPGLALQERGLSLVAGCRKGNGAAVMRWFRRRLQRWSWRKTVSVSCGRGRKKKKKNLQKLGEDAGFLLTLDPNFSSLRSSTEILFIGGVRGPYCLYWGKFSALDSTRGIQTVGSKCAPRAAKFGSSRP